MRMFYVQDPFEFVPHCSDMEKQQRMGVWWGVRPRKINGKGNRITEIGWMKKGSQQRMGCVELPALKQRGPMNPITHSSHYALATLQPRSSLAPALHCCSIDTTLWEIYGEGRVRLPNADHAPPCG